MQDVEEMNLRGAFGNGSHDKSLAQCHVEVSMIENRNTNDTPNATIIM